MVTSPDGRRTSVTALSLDGVDAAAAAFQRALALGGGVILLLVAAVIWLLVRSLARPIIGITAVATRIADGHLDTDLDTDLDAPTRSREIAELNDALERMLTRLRSTLEEREQFAAEATRARDDMQHFLADMAHELRTPLTALKGYSDLYAGGMLESAGDVDRAMSRIGSESERLYRLADDMLRLARDGASDDPTELVDVATIAAGVVDDLRAAYPDHRIGFQRRPGRPSGHRNAGADPPGDPQPRGERLPARPSVRRGRDPGPVGRHHGRHASRRPRPGDRSSRPVPGLPAVLPHGRIAESPGPGRRRARSRRHPADRRPAPRNGHDRNHAGRRRHLRADAGPRGDLTGDHPATVGRPSCAVRADDADPASRNAVDPAGQRLYVSDVTAPVGAVKVKLTVVSVTV